MNKFSKLIVLSLISAFMALPLTATAERGHGPRGHHKGKSLFQKVGKMQKKLDLSDEQADKVFEIFKSAKKSKGQCKEAETFSAKKACMEEKRAGIDSQVSAVLNDEQKAKFTEMKAKRESRRKEKRH